MAVETVGTTDSGGHIIGYTQELDLTLLHGLHGHGKLLNGVVDDSQLAVGGEGDALLQFGRQLVGQRVADCGHCIIKLEEGTQVYLTAAALHIGHLHFTLAIEVVEAEVGRCIESVGSRIRASDAVGYAGHLAQGAKVNPLPAVQSITVGFVG